MLEIIILLLALGILAILFFLFFPAKLPLHDSNQSVSERTLADAIREHERRARDEARDDGRGYL